MSQLSAVAEARERNLARRHHEWRQKPQDISVVFTDTVVRKVAAAAKRVAMNAGKFGIAIRGKPAHCKELLPGHPPMLGIEHVDLVIMTVKLTAPWRRSSSCLSTACPRICPSCQYRARGTTTGGSRQCAGMPGRRRDPEGAHRTCTGAAMSFDPSMRRGGMPTAARCTLRQGHRHRSGRWHSG